MTNTTQKFRLNLYTPMGLKAQIIPAEALQEKCRILEIMLLKFKATAFQLLPMSEQHKSSTAPIFYFGKIIRNASGKLCVQQENSCSELKQNDVILNSENARCEYGARVLTLAAPYFKPEQIRRAIFAERTRDY